MASNLLPNFNAQNHLQVAYGKESHLHHSAMTSATSSGLGRVGETFR